MGPRADFVLSSVSAIPIGEMEAPAREYAGPLGGSSAFFLGQRIPDFSRLRILKKGI